MRNVVFAMVLGLGVLALALCLALAINGSQPQPTHQLKNGYYPFTVETEVRDRS